MYTVQRPPSRDRQSYGLLCPIYMYKIWLFRFCIFVLFGGAATGLQAQAPNLMVGFGQRDITPPLAVNNWITGKPYTHVHDPLNVRVVVISDGRHKSALVSLELVDAGESATHEIRTALAHALGIPFYNILVTATHTHSAPWAPVYEEGFRGAERDTWWAIRYMPAQNNDPPFRKWMTDLIAHTVAAAGDADRNLKPATLWIGKADISAFANNRRPRLPEWGTAGSNTPQGYNFRHPEYNPLLLTDGSNYGPLDRTMSIVSFRDEQGDNLVTLFHAAIHSVAIYPYSEELTADWPGEAAAQLQSRLGGNVMFLQGAAGDINPWRRGREAVTEMGKGIAERGQAAFRFGTRLIPDSLVIINSEIALPLDTTGKQRTGLDAVAAEVQVLTIGPLAFVTLPGEPLTDLGTAIRDRSPFPHTLVIGYSNGNGVHYVGLPGEKEKGGYEMTHGTVGTDEAGLLLVGTAVRLLNEARTKAGNSR